MNNSDAGSAAQSDVGWGFDNGGIIIRKHRHPIPPGILMPLMILYMEYLCCLGNEEGPSRSMIIESVRKVTEHYTASMILHGMGMPPMEWSKLIRRGSGMGTEETEWTEEDFQRGESAV